MARPDPGATGRTITPLTPVGDVSIDGHDYLARSVDDHLPAGVNIVVTSADENGVFVKRREAVADSAQMEPQKSDGAGLTMQVIGGVIAVVGACLLVGNTTGIFPTFPFAGFIVMGIGGALLSAGRRAA
jgi:hypothetical protein